MWRSIVHDAPRTNFSSPAIFRCEALDNGVAFLTNYCDWADHTSSCVCGICNHCPFDLAFTLLKCNIECSCHTCILICAYTNCIFGPWMVIALWCVVHMSYKELCLCFLSLYQPCKEVLHLLNGSGKRLEITPRFCKLSDLYWIYLHACMLFYFPVSCVVSVKCCISRVYWCTVHHVKLL